MSLYKRRPPDLKQNSWILLAIASWVLGTNTSSGLLGRETPWKAMAMLVGDTAGRGLAALKGVAVLVGVPASRRLSTLIHSSRQVCLVLQQWPLVVAKRRSRRAASPFGQCLRRAATREGREAPREPPGARSTTLGVRSRVMGRYGVRPGTWCEPSTHLAGRRSGGAEAPERSLAPHCLAYCASPQSLCQNDL